jgi:prevent-host-death family protein
MSISEASRQFTRLVERADKRTPVIVTSHGKAKAVLLSIASFEDLIGMREYAQRPLMPLSAFQKQFRQALTEAGYETRDQIIELVNEVKHEQVNAHTPRRKPQKRAGRK